MKRTDPPPLTNRIATGVNLITMSTKKCKLKRKKDLLYIKYHSQVLNRRWIINS